MLNTEARKIIRNEAARQDCRYRIAKNGEVHFYGQMPNTNQVGWYLEAQDALAYAVELARNA
jgi:hypothetical protein